jgi:S-adenosylmethionine synthetase
VAAETLCNTGLVVLAGEITTTANVDYIQVARDTIKRIGYDNTDYGIDYKGCAVLVAYDKQSPDIAQGVDRASDDYLNQGAGDQGLMFGYACDETPELMPFPIYYAHRLVERQSQLRRTAACPGCVRTPSRRSPCATWTAVRTASTPWCCRPSTRRTSRRPDPRSRDRRDHQAGAAGRDAQGHQVPGQPDRPFRDRRPAGDCGLTGRKIIVDTYGGAAPHGGGAFSGKDPSKVDRSAAYAARYVAKNIVAAGLARQCQVQVSYAIGVARPINVTVYTEGTGKISDEKIAALVQEHFDLRPKGIVQMLDLLRPIYEKTAAYGHFGREEPEFSWEATDKAAILRAAAGL